MQCPSFQDLHEPAQMVIVLARLRVVGQVGYFAGKYCTAFDDNSFLYPPLNSFNTKTSNTLQMLGNKMIGDAPRASFIILFLGKKELFNY